MSDHPNIVLIMADQWRGDCLSGAEHPVVKTPFLDALARRGVRFAGAYSACPTCVPARASLLTGQRPTTHGRVGYQDHVPWTFPVTLAGELTRHGYQTEAVGKMHFFPERTRMGFEHIVLHSPLGIVRSARQRGLDPDLVDDYLPWLRHHLGRDATFADHGLDSNSYIARPWDKPEHLHPTNFVATQAADFLRRRDPTKPFFLFASFNAPHPPYDPPGWAFDQYRDLPMAPVPVGDWTAVFDPYAKPHDPTAHVDAVDAPTVRRARAGYYGHITHVDAQINFLLEQIEEYGLRDDTYVCFVSDHGEMLGEHHLFRKGYPYEGSARVPLILAGPPGASITPATAPRDRVVELRDIMPTLLDCAGVPIPAGVEGSSLLPLARGENPSWRDHLHGEHPLFGQTLQWLTDGHHKYVWHSGTGHEQLFDLDRDPGELHDLAPSAADRTLARWRAILVQELGGREEGYVHNAGLVTGRPPQRVLSHPGPPRVSGHESDLGHHT